MTNLLKNSPDVFYYNISVKNSNINSTSIYGADAKSERAYVLANNDMPICANPSEYYCSIIRFTVPCQSVPLILFKVQEPVLDINKGVYSFTMRYVTSTGTVLATSQQTFYNYIQTNFFEVAPQVGTPRQQNTSYYFIYDYYLLSKIMNTCLSSCLANLKTQGGTGAIATAADPYFLYTPATQSYTVYAEESYFSSNSGGSYIQIFFNSLSYNFMYGFPYVSVAEGSANGLDSYLSIENINYSNVEVVPPPPTVGGLTYVKCLQQYPALCYINLLNSIILTTNNNINTETYYSNENSLNRPNNQVYTKVLTDFMPDLSGANDAGASSKIFIYNASSLYRIFQFIQETPLMEISLNIYILDAYGNYYPLYLNRDSICTIKFMFIKKSAFRFNSKV